MMTKRVTIKIVVIKKVEAFKVCIKIETSNINNEGS